MQELEYEIEHASRIMSLLGNPIRLAVLCKLYDRDHSVSELTQKVGISQSALSQHLAKMRKLHLVKTKRSAQTIYYSLAGKEAVMLLRTLHALYCADAEKHIAPNDNSGSQENT